MRMTGLAWRFFTGVVLAVAIAGCGSSGPDVTVPTTTDPNAPKLSPVGKEPGGGGEEAAARTPEAEPLGVD
jgi:hypothetical protein